MKKVTLLLLSLILIFCLTACGASETNISKNDSSQNTTTDTMQNSGVYEPKTEPKPKSSEIEEKNDMKNIEIIIGNKTFSARLYNNEVAKRFKENLPMTLDMSELNGNEKYYYLSMALPVEASRPDEIHVGDLMLYGNNCLVLFYEGFSTSYSYTPLGRIDDPNGLAEALGSGSVQVTFK